ncbi:hypothetical protein BMF94_4040 [Rhodotorula taiwanensis]|uniref:Uncharacterized protein n=1 Tax=Rhodotorula taiwanensis TaxID=741276 RepID=A0A2S5B7Z1_9BASI|nr:hypothetical protein BMF94_4040 [Rhodotorula taiwanensis]
MGGVSYLYDSPNIKWSCPSGTGSYALWSKTTPTGYDITGKLAVGAGCSAEVTFSGTTGQFGGAVGPDGVTYGCSTNDGNDFVWYSLEGEKEWAYATLCLADDMEDKEHKLIIKNSPLLGSSLFITNFAGLSREGGEGKTSLGPAGIKTVPVPTPDAAYTSSIQAKASEGAASLKSSFASVSSVSLVSQLSKSLLADKTTASTSVGSTQSTSNNLATTINTAASTAGSSAVVDSKSFTTTTFVLISATVLAIIVVALIVAMCWNSTPKKDPARKIEESLSAKHREHRRRLYHLVKKRHFRKESQRFRVGR